jgi:hypothetical protein
MSLEPAIALLANLLVFGQIPGAAAAAGIMFVVIAGIGAPRTGFRTPQPTTTAMPRLSPRGEHRERRTGPVAPNTRSTGFMAVRLGLIDAFTSHPLSGSNLFGLSLLLACDPAPPERG